jgi:hypothetical protein
MTDKPASKRTSSSAFQELIEMIVRALAEDSSQGRRVGSRRAPSASPQSRRSRRYRSPINPSDASLMEAFALLIGIGLALLVIWHAEL